MTVLEILTQTKANYAQQLLDLSKSPMMDHSVDGRQYSPEGYQRYLVQAIKDLDIQIASEEGTYEVVIQGIP